MHITKNPPNNQLRYLAILVLLLAAIIWLQSCSATRKAERAEKKALLPYLSVINDVDTSYAKKKKAYASIFCGLNFPIEVKKERYDSIVYKPIRVIDNTKVNQLRKEVERLRNLTPNINVDSLYQSYYDSVLNALPECKGYEHYKSSDETKKDTISLYNMANSNSDLHNKVNALNADISILNKHIEDLNKDINDANKLKDKWKWRCILACMFIVGSWGLYGYFKIRKSLMPKI